MSRKAAIIIFLTSGWAGLGWAGLGWWRPKHEDCCWLHLAPQSGVKILQKVEAALASTPHSLPFPEPTPAIYCNMNRFKKDL